MGLRSPAQLPEPFTIEKLVPMMDEAGVDRVVVVPPSWPGDRNDYALEAAESRSVRRDGSHSTGETGVD
jgi:predicted TIM-barrel fold metal-dependent hydrolase